MWEVGELLSQWEMLQAEAEADSSTSEIVSLITFL